MRRALTSEYKPLLQTRIQREMGKVTRETEGAQGGRRGVGSKDLLRMG